MVKIYFYGDEQQMEQIPENYFDFIQIVGAFFNIGESEVTKLFLEYTSDEKTYTLLDEKNYNNFFFGGNSETKVYVYFSLEETNTYKNKNQEDKKIEEKNEEKIEEKEEEDEIENNNEINTNSNDKNKIDEKENDDKEIKVPEITKDMVIASIVKQVKENMQKSRLILQEKQKKEEEERKRLEKEENERKEKEKEQKKGISDQINNLITNRLDNLKEELINESQIKFSEIMSESQINLDKIYENNIISDEKKEIIHSLEEHPGITCSKCGKNPIVGNRYCCVYCNDVNYCEECEEKNGLIHGHPLYKLKLRIE